MTVLTLLLFGSPLLGCSQPDAPALAGAPKTATWAPGDDIPGWEDQPCPELKQGEVEVDGYDSPFQTHVGVVGEADGSFGGWALSLGVADCVNSPCEVSDGDVDGPGTYIEARATWYTSDVIARAMGTYLEDVEEGPELTSTWGVSLLGTWSHMGEGEPLDNTVATMCVERFRPDGFRAVVSARYLPRHWEAVESPWYPDFSVRHVIEVSWPPHSAEQYPADEVWTDEPEHDPLYRSISYYAAPYNEAWPWDEITDEAIRAQVWQMYLPYNDPEGDG